MSDENTPASDPKPTPKFKPSDYLRKRRPERYSDSVLVDEPQLSRDFLDYHLDSLTSCSQELDFEVFARKLAEITLCPNLLPNTGPTGGGDSKVETEAYPVSYVVSFLGEGTRDITVQSAGTPLNNRLV